MARFSLPRFSSVSLTPYLVGHALLIASYAAVRSWYPDARIQHESSYFSGFTNEADYGVFTLILIAQKLRRVANIDDFLDATIQYSELTVLAFAFLTSPSVFVAYCLVTVATWLLLRKTSRALGSKVLQMTPYDVAIARQPRAEGGPKWLILAGQQRSDSILRDFVEVADKCKKASLRFGYVDLSEHPQAAAALEVDVGTFAMQVPSVLLLDTTGSISKRLPFLNDDGTAQSVKIDATAITLHFGA